MGDIKLIKSALKACADRYEDVQYDHRRFSHYTDQIDATAVPDPDGTQNAAIAMEGKPQVIEALRKINDIGDQTLARLATSLRDTSDEYQRAEEENTQLIEGVRASFSTYGDLTDYELPPNTPKPRDQEPGRTDWSHGNASEHGHLDEPLPTADNNWDAMGLAMAISNVDFMYKAEVPDYVRMLIEKMFDWTGMVVSLEKCKASWYPLDVLGKGVMAEGRAYVVVSESLKNDISVLSTNWEGDGHRAADAALAKCQEWFLNAGERAQKVGQDIHEQAESSVAVLTQLHYAVQALVGAIPAIGTVLSLWNIGMSLVEFFNGCLKGRWWELWRVIGNVVMTVIGFACAAVGIVLAIWSLVQLVVQLLRHAVTTGPHSLEVDAAVWA